MSLLKTITGDASDNIKGAEKIGPKTAAALLRQFGTVEYSSNTTDGGSLSARKGTVNGYACRSVISIASAMARDLYNHPDAETESIIDSIDGDGKISWVPGVATTDNGKAILEFVCSHAGLLEAMAQQ